jgi:hypothetical protein
MNLKRIFASLLGSKSRGNKTSMQDKSAPANKHVPDQIQSMTMDDEEKEFDRCVGFYYTNLINSLILFSLSETELEKLEGPGFDPMFELESEIDFAYTNVCFETIFRNNMIDIALKNELLDFKQATNDIPSEVWDWEFIDHHPSWIAIRRKANELLDKLGISNRIYNDDYITIYDGPTGKIIKQGRKP